MKVYNYILILLFVVSIGYAMSATRTLLILEQNVEELCEYIEELEDQNKYLKEVID